jgi:hypothetical protein
MIQSARQLDLTPRTPLIVASETMLAALDDGRPLSRTGVSAVLCQAYGGSDATGAWGQADLHAAVELAQP